MIKLENGMYTDFYDDGWDAVEYAHCMRAAYNELKLKGIKEPHVDYGVALDWHRRNRRKVYVIPAEQIREVAA